MENYTEFKKIWLTESLRKDAERMIEFYDVPLKNKADGFSKLRFAIQNFKQLIESFVEFDLTESAIGQKQALDYRIARMNLSRLFNLISHTLKEIDSEIDVKEYILYFNEQLEEMKNLLIKAINNVTDGEDEILIDNVRTLAKDVEQTRNEFDNLLREHNLESWIGAVR